MTNPVTNPEAAGSDWKTFYKVGAVAALLVLVPALLDIFITFFPWGGAPAPGKGSISNWFTWLQANAFLALRALGLWNVLTLTLGVPVFFALYGAHRLVRGASAGLALILFLMGTTIYIANNPALPLFSLSGHYPSAAIWQKPLLLAAGQSLLARGEDWTPGFIPGFLFTHLAGLLMALVMLRGGIFSRATAWVGVWGWIFSLIFVIWYTFISALPNLALLTSMLGGLLLLAWYVLIAFKLFQLAAHSS